MLLLKVLYELTFISEGNIKMKKSTFNPLEQSVKKPTTTVTPIVPISTSSSLSNQEQIKTTNTPNQSSLVKNILINII